MLKGSNSNDEILPLTNHQLIQRSSFSETIQTLFFEQENARKGRSDRRLHQDLVELVIGITVLAAGIHIPKYCGAYFFFESLIAKPPPMQITKAGDVIVDLQLNEPLVDPATVSSSLLIVLGLILPAIFLFIHESLQPTPRRPLLVVGSFLTATGICEFITSILKLVVQRRRPNFYALCGFDEQQRACVNEASPLHIVEAQLSFPSGHSSLSMCAAVFVWCCLLLRSGRQRQRTTTTTTVSWKVGVTTVCTIGMSVAVGITRLVDHWHHPSDVLAGWWLGAAVATGVFRWHPVLVSVHKDTIQSNAVAP